MWTLTRMMRVSPYNCRLIISLLIDSCVVLGEGEAEETTEPPPAAEEQPTEVGKINRA